MHDMFSLINCLKAHTYQIAFQGIDHAEGRHMWNEIDLLSKTFITYGPQINFLVTPVPLINT